MTLPLLPKATAVWLVDNTTLTFDQISDFCGMHPMEVQGIADGEVAAGIIGKSPVLASQLSKDEIARCENDDKASLKLLAAAEKYIKSNQEKKKKSRYTPVARRQDKPDAIAWIIKHCPDVKDSQLTKLIGTTKNTIAAIREKSHWNWGNITPRDPVLLGLCKQIDLNKMVEKVNADREKEEAIKNAKPKKKA